MKLRTYLRLSVGTWAETTRSDRIMQELWTLEVVCQPCGPCILLRVEMPEEAFLKRTNFMASCR